LVEKPIEQAVRRERRIDQFLVGDSRKEDRGAAPILRSVAARHISRDALHQNAARTPTAAGIIDDFSNRETDAGIGLLAVLKGSLRAARQRRAVNGHNALIGGPAVALIEGDDEIAGAEQFTRRQTLYSLQRRGGPFCQPGVSAQCASRRIL